MLTRKNVLDELKAHPDRGDATFSNKFVRDSVNSLEETLAELNSNPNLKKNMSNADILEEILNGENTFLKINFKPKSKNKHSSKNMIYELIMGISKKQTLDGGEHEIQRLPIISLMYLKYRFLHAFGVPPYYSSGKINHYKSNIEGINKRNNIHCCPKCSHVFQEA